MIIEQDFEKSDGTLGTILNKSLTTNDYFKERGFVFSDPKLPEPPKPQEEQTEEEAAQ